MAKANKVFVRVGINDVVMTEDDAKKVSNYIEIFDKDGNKIGDAETYTVGYEDEDGNECHEDGEYLN